MCLKTIAHATMANEDFNQILIKIINEYTKSGDLKYTIPFTTCIFNSSIGKRIRLYWEIVQSKSYQL